jgi:hypothetical protein
MSIIMQVLTRTSPICQFAKKKIKWFGSNVFQFTNISRGKEWKQYYHCATTTRLFTACRNAQTFQQQKTESVLVTKENQSVNYNFSSIEYLVTSYQI